MSTRVVEIKTLCAMCRSDLGITQNLTVRVHLPLCMCRRIQEQYRPCGVANVFLRM